MPDRVPQEANEAAYEAVKPLLVGCVPGRSRALDEQLDAILEAAYPAIREAVLVGVERELLGDEAVQAGAHAEFAWVNPHCNTQEAAEERDSFCESFQAGLKAALATLKEEGPGNGAEMHPEEHKAHHAEHSLVAAQLPEEGPTDGAGECEPADRIAATVALLRKYEDGEAGPATQGDPGARAIVQFAQHIRELIEEPLPADCTEQVEAKGKYPSKDSGLFVGDEL